MPTLSLSALVDSTPPKLSLDGEKDVNAMSDYCTLPRAPRSAKRLEYLFAKTKDDDALLEEKRIEEEQKLKEYKEAPKEVCFILHPACNYSICYHTLYVL